MEGERVSEDPSVIKEKGKSRLTDIFNEQFPQYLAMGMTYDLYWYGDNDLPQLYRKAYDLQRKIKDETCWLQGMYFYEALCDVAPILRSFAKAGTNPKPYSKEPYMLSQEKKENDANNKEIAYENSKAVIHSWVAKVNRSKGVKDNG